jgi:hypothetical protein
MRHLVLEKKMPSNTKFTRFRRKLRRKNMGKERKAALRANGTTPTFPIHTAEVDANAPVDQVSPASRD